MDKLVYLLMQRDDSCMYDTEFSCVGVFTSKEKVEMAKKFCQKKTNAVLSFKVYDLKQDTIY